jgi:hypothetical protein
MVYSIINNHYKGDVKMPRQMPGRKSITAIFTETEYENIRTLAAKKNTSMNEIVRKYVMDGLNGTITQENLDFLIPIIRDQLKSIINPAVDRLSSISAKACIQAGAAAYLSAEALNKFVPDDRAEEFIESYEKARKKSVAYLKGLSEID